MGEFHEIREVAVQLQQALDGARGSLTSPALDRARRLLRMAMMAAASGSGQGDYNIFEHIIRRTTLAASIVAFLERVPWAEITPQMLSETVGGGIAVVDVTPQMVRGSGGRIPRTRVVPRMVMEPPRALNALAYCISTLSSMIMSACKSAEFSSSGSSSGSSPLPALLLRQVGFQHPLRWVCLEPV